MKLLLIRHGPAGTREAFAATGQDDDERPLSKDGERRMRQVARGLRRTVPSLDLLATSPLERAAQSAAIIGEAYGHLAPQEEPILAPGVPPRELAAWLGTEKTCDTIAVVGHEPDLSSALAWFVAGIRRPLGPLKKGGAGLLEFPGVIDEGRGELLWLMRPGQLRKLGS